MRLDFSKSSIQFHVGGCDPRPYAGALTLDGVLNGVQAAAIVTLDGAGVARWNTPDGHRWSVAEAKAALSAGIQPWIYTPWSFTAVRTVRGVVAGTSADVSGGSVGGDSITDCPPLGHQPQVGHTFLGEFATEPGAGRQTIIGLMPYDPATRTVQTPYGALALPT